MKRFIALTLALLLSCTSMPAVFAEVDTKQMESVLLTVKERIGDTSEYTEFYSNYYDGDKYQAPFYEFNWSGDEKYLSVSCTPDGIITRYYKSMPYDYMPIERKRIKSSDDEEMVSKAVAFMDRLNPQLKGHYLPADNAPYKTLYSYDYYYSFVRYVNNIPTSDTASVNLNSETLEPVSLYLNYTNADFESPDDILSIDEAKNAYRNLVGMKLKYVRDYSTEEPKIIPVYANDSTAINAITGEIYTVIDDYRVYNLGAAESKDAMGEFTPAESAEIGNISELISQDEAIAIITDKAKYLDLPADYTVTCNLQSYGGRYAYYIWFNNDEDFSAYCSVNAKTGEINFFNSYNYSQEQTAYTDEQLDKAAQEAVNALAPGRAEKFVLKDSMNNEYDKLDRNYNYERYVNDILVSFDSISLTMSNVSGKVTNFSISYTDEEFPAVDNIISQSESMDKAFELSEFKLRYSFEHTEKGVIGKLIYIFEDTYIEIDALTGKPVHDSSGPVLPAEYTDLDGHYAQESIMTLAQYGITLGNEETFRPSEAITQRDYIGLALKVAADYEPYYRTDDDLFRAARRFNIVNEDEFNPDGPVTRADAAKYLIRAIGADEYASINGIFLSPYVDVIDNIGYIALLYGMGVIKGNGSNEFYPTENLTRADAMVIMYNYLTRE